MPTNKRPGTDTTAVTTVADDDVLLLVGSGGEDRHITGANARSSLGSGGSSAGPITITGDGSATSFDVTHNLGTRSVEWYFEDEANAPLKVSSWVPTVGDELNSSTVSIPGPIGDGDEVYGYARPASSTPLLQQINTQTGTAYTIAASDVFGIVEMTSSSANTVTIPANADVVIPVGGRVDIVQIGVGATTIAAAAGVTLNSVDSLTQIETRYMAVTAYKRATNEWNLIGALA